MYAPKIPKPPAAIPTSAAKPVARQTVPHVASEGFHQDFSGVAPRAVRPQRLETTLPFHATIRVADSASGQAEKRAVSPRQTKAEPGTKPVERDKGVLFIAQMGGAPIVASAHDAVAATINYLPTTTRGGVTMGSRDFGTTDAALKRFSNVVITPETGKFTVTADLKLAINWDTLASVGPRNQVNIASETAPALTSANYTKAVSDLTPDPAALKGKSPRENFWCKDLSEKHELFHVKDNIDVVRQGSVEAVTGLNARTVATREEVPPLLDAAINAIATKMLAFMAMPGMEERAYSDGAPSYTARAAAIKAKGDARGYPAPATPPSPAPARPAPAPAPSAPAPAPH